VDRLAARVTKEEFDEMRGEPNIGATGKMPGLLQLFIGMMVILTESLLPPRYVRGAPGKVVGIELHPMEPQVEGRTSIVSDGVVVLHYMPKCVYVKMEGSDELFLQAAPGTPAVLLSLLAPTCVECWRSPRRPAPGSSSQRRAARPSRSPGLN